MRRLFITTASVIALSVGGAGLAAAAGSSANSTMSGSGASMSGASSSHGMQASVSRSEVKQAQQQLKSEGLYNGQIDGIVGPETKQALSEYQKKEGLKQTATLDKQTLDRLMGHQGAASGSSASPASSSQGNSSNPQNQGGTSQPAGQSKGSSGTQTQ
ncbi:MAG TPA: peptidoglycan-binding domain-containing protein [Stellaceae bacterium]|nr:peptidoglycan-binding domain-containing protein [Stellaceae bacterium]